MTRVSVLIKNLLFAGLEREGENYTFALFFTEFFLTMQVKGSVATHKFQFGVTRGLIVAC